MSTDTSQSHQPADEADTAVHRGLDGVIEDTTEISQINPATNSLIYRGYPAEQLAASRTFEEVAHLIWTGELPTPEQLSELTGHERENRELSRPLRDLVRALPDTCHPMDVLRTAVSVVGAEDPTEEDPSPERNRDRSIVLLAKLPTVVALDHRRRQGLDAISPDPSLSLAQNFFRMYFGQVPADEVVRAFEVSLIMYAEHGFNASTFAARVVTSTLSDLYSAVAAAIGALKGPLHGGANEAVVRTLREIGPAGNVAGWLDRALADKVKVMGFGHRVYKSGDSRVPTLAQLDRLTADGTAAERVGAYRALKSAMLERTHLHPNVDYPTGLVYDVMGFDLASFTPIFAMARVVGWTAHIAEQRAANAIIRPLSRYTGPTQRSVPA
ncbi:MAG: bifunctional 2-methylcitrate synthase/citrate synthase [Intrasporangium sp.]|uniref:bifunctional 2-methylcitrate synthase/citrate synthase n=1 Tax=Intrasporangium sp. TaxID=1925024 RepID=UPI002647E173|nr:bifunctional 2-methylcitrate synthase/citrate synthase [Intrasporangium sp.]MDN5796658.1 bifunctional 2-methylcitrate synthase/citrate synthase [Intrasporangium sp.]